MSQVREYVERRELLTNLVLRELRSRYKRSTLGWTWSLLNPLSSVLIYWAVFGVFLKVVPPVGHPSGQQNFVLFLICALIPWNYFSNGVLQSVDALVVNAGLIRKVYFPRELLVASTVGGLLVTFLIELSVVFTVLLIAGNMIIPWVPVVIVLVVLQSLIILGIGLMLSGANVYFRDFRHFVTLLMPALFYSTPIVYPISTVPSVVHIAGRSIPLRTLCCSNSSEERLPTSSPSSMRPGPGPARSTSAGFARSAATGDRRRSCSSRRSKTRADIATVESIYLNATAAQRLNAHEQNLAEESVFDCFLQKFDAAVEAVLKCNDQMFFVLLRRVDHLLAFGGVHGERLFAEHIEAVVES